MAQVSHRSGETEDSFIADLVVGLRQKPQGSPCSMIGWQTNDISYGMIKYYLINITIRSISHYTYMHMYIPIYIYIYTHTYIYIYTDTIQKMVCCIHQYYAICTYNEIISPPVLQVNIPAPWNLIGVASTLAALQPPSSCNIISYDDLIYQSDIYTYHN